MSKSFKGQFDDENVLLVFKRHPIVMRKGIVYAMVSLLLGAVGGLVYSGNAISINEFIYKFLVPLGIGFGVGCIFMFYSWIGWHHSVCIVTNVRFIQVNQTGVFKSREVHDIDLNRILSVNYEVRGLIENLLGFGTIIIQTLVGDMYLARVSKPSSTQGKIVSAIKESGVQLEEKIEEDY